MLRRFLDWQLALTAEGKPLHRLRPLIDAVDHFCYESAEQTKRGPHIRDAIDTKRWMMLVVVALIPATLMAIWNTGLQATVYGSGDFRLMDAYLAATHSFSSYFAFAAEEGRWLTFLKEGLLAVGPIILISYVVGGAVEGLFAVVRKHSISEGFLVTGILYALILPPTIPYWMVAIGVAAGVLFAKELFGGSGMNVINPALACRAFLFFTFPGRMSGNVWVGTNPKTIRDSLLEMNQEAGRSSIDGYTQATKLAQFNVPSDIKRIHVDAIATNDLGESVGTIEVIKKQFASWNQGGEATLGALSSEQMQNFVTSPLQEGGLALSPGYYEDAAHFSQLQYGGGDWNLFFGDRLGSVGETSPFFCLLGALFLIWVGIGSWRTMAAMGLGAWLCAACFTLGAQLFGADGGAWNPAQFAFPPHKHLLLGGLAFGLVFMATDPVSSPSMPTAQWAYGILCGVISIVIRTINPAFPEGVMLAILMGNVFAPLFDYYAALNFRKRRLRYVRKAA